MTDMENYAAKKTEKRTVKRRYRANEKEKERFVSEK